MSRDDYEGAVQSFVRELIGVFEAQSAKQLPSELHDALAVQLSLLVETNATPSERVAASFAVVDQYLESTWQQRLDEGYQLYRDLHKGE